MSGELNPLEYPQAWDVIMIGGVVSPGICKVSGIKRINEWDIKKGKGSQGATITFVQKPPAKFSVQIFLWRPQDFTDWDNFRPFLKYDPTKKEVQAIDIWHPALADVDISSVVTESIGGVTHEGAQLYSVTIEFLEYFPPPKTSSVGNPTGSKQNAEGAKGNKNNPPGDTPKDADAELVKQNQDLAKQAQDSW